MALIDLLGKPIAFQRCFVELTGSVTAALFLSYALERTRQAKEHDGWFCASQDDLRHETGLSRFEQETARRLLKERGFLKERRVGVPARLHYMIDVAAVERLLISAYMPDMSQDFKSADIQQSSMRETSKLDCDKLTNKIASLPQSSLREISNHPPENRHYGRLETTISNIYNNNNNNNNNINNIYKHHVKSYVFNNIPEQEVGLVDAVRPWYVAQGFAEDIDLHFRHFIKRLPTLANPPRDPAALFCKAIIDDWAGLRKPKPVVPDLPAWAMIPKEVGKVWRFICEHGYPKALGNLHENDMVRGLKREVHMRLEMFFDAGGRDVYSEKRRTA